MVVYRAIEFDKLFHLTDKYFTYQFKNAIEKTKIDNSINWWYLPEFDTLKNQVLRNIYDNQSDFFQKSIDFNSKNGGRFNPEKSFGCVYTSSCPTLSALEVLYHSFDRNRILYKNLKKSSDKISNAFNINVPEEFRSKIVVFEIKIDESLFEEICETKSNLKDLCKQLGFNRYINRDFDENFIFGNDYDIGNIIGCHFNAISNKNLKVPSARLPLDFQKKSEKFNIILYEDKYDDSISLTGKVREYDCLVSLEEQKNVGYKVDLSVLGERSKRQQFFLQPWPSKSNNQIVEYSQISDTEKKYSRQVHIQKFHSAST